ncbi:MAG: hypothetical protein Q8O47_07290, partial [Candidatus Bathyarchaeota archaeon]|nr:hypothetical protein [Candidatus Bathyarchaeota archaeon]
LKILIPKQFQNITSNITLFLAVSPDGERHLVEIEKTESETGGPTAALRRRISDNKILLTAFTEKATRELIEKRLKISRITGKIEKEPLIPFNEEFVKFIHEITDGRPEMIIDRCNNVLDVGLEQRIPLLTKQFAIEVFKERGIQIES